MENPQLSIITVNFGSAQKVIKLYQSVLRYSTVNSWEMIIVDNPTQKAEDAKILADFFRGTSQVHLITLDKNVGYGAANNEGVKFAQGKYLAICNPDTEVRKNAFDELIKTLENNKNIGLAVPVLKTSTGKLLENCRKFPTFFSLIKRRIVTRPFIEKIPRKKIITTSWAQGSFWVLTRKTFKKLNGFDERFFLFMEDIDFCRRVWLNNQKIVQNTQSLAIHSPNRLSGGFIFSAVFRKTFWIHLWSAVLYFQKWLNQKIPNISQDFN